MIRIWYTVLCLLFLCQVVMADDKRDAEEIVKGKLDAVFAVPRKRRSMKSSRRCLTLR